MVLCMIVGVVGYGRENSKLQRMYIEQSNFTAIECDGLKRLCNLELHKKNEINPYSELDRGLTAREAKEVEELADSLYQKYQYDIVSKAIDKINYPGSPLFINELVKQETPESIDKLKDTFYISKIYSTEKRKVSNYYLLGIDFKCDAITFNNAKYLLETRVLVKNNPFDFKVISVNFDIL